MLLNGHMKIFIMDNPLKGFNTWQGHHLFFLGSAQKLELRQLKPNIARVYGEDGSIQWTWLIPKMRPSCLT